MNRTDPRGTFSEALIESSLHGATAQDVFGVERYAVARWGLYAVLRNAKDLDTIVMRYADFSYEGDDYPLAPDPGGPWQVYSLGCDLLFENALWGTKTLPEFISILNMRAENWADTSGKWWRPATLQFHWYELNGALYSDFSKGSDMPDVVIVGGTFQDLGGASVLFTQDRYGNAYQTYSAGLGFAVGAGAEAWEGYASLTGPDPSFHRIPEEGVLRDDVIQGLSVGATASIGGGGVGGSWWDVGRIALFGSPEPFIGVNVSLGYTFITGTSFRKQWHWVDTKIPTYNSSIRGNK